MISRSGRVHGAAFDIDCCGALAIGSGASGRSTLNAAALRRDASLVPDRVSLVPVDRRLGRSRRVLVDRATALAGLIRGISSLFLSGPYASERRAILEVLGELVAVCPASAVRLGRDLLAASDETFGQLLDSDGGG